MVFKIFSKIVLKIITSIHTNIMFRTNALCYPIAESKQKVSIAFFVVLTLILF